LRRFGPNTSEDDIKPIAVFVIAIIFVSLGSSCTRQQDDRASVDSLIETAVTAPMDSGRQVEVLRHLMAIGKPVEIHNDIWTQGPSYLEAKPPTEDLEGLKSSRLVKVDGLHYIFSGSLEGKSTLCLLCVRSYPDGKLRFTKLAEATYIDDK
jgi:hypothetical protein